MGDLWLNAGRALRAVRSGAFLLVYAGYLSAVVGLGQRLVLWPAVVLAPRRRGSLVRAWLRAHALATLGMARRIAGVRVSVEGAIAPGSCVVVMNHQSLLDIPIGIALVRGPYPLIPTRDRYMRGIPGISPLLRLGGFPSVSQRRPLPRAELLALTAAADQVARGDRSLLIFPEGHRTRDGRIGRFMRSGLRIVLRRARRPVYCVVVDGATASRTLADALTRFAGSDVRVTVLGPFAPPEAPDGATPDDAALDAFIETLHARMTAALAGLRGARDDAPLRAGDPLAAR
jgi:1-acyl-sn-glycerol-3-phosphate acyltransferase